MRHSTLLEPSVRGCRMIKKSVLVVEDEEDIRELVSYHLLKEGYQVAGVASGKEALATAEARPPDLILLNLMLPGVDGLTVCQRLRNNPRTESVPIVMLTAKGEESDIVGGLNLGANDYVTKPFSPKVLLARVRAALRRIPAQRSSKPKRMAKRARKPSRSTNCKSTSGGMKSSSAASPSASARRSFASSVSSPASPAGSSAGSRSSTASTATTTRSPTAPSTSRSSA